VTSPVSPVSPLNPTNVLTTQTPPATVHQTPVLNNPTTTAGLPAPTAASSAPSSTAQTDAKGIGIKTLPLALSFEIFIKPLTQPNVFPDLNISQELPNDIKIQQQTYMDLITYGSLFNPDQTDKLNRIASDAVELEQ
jgi:hypothetical protein